jgi:hypothetical protein
LPSPPPFARIAVTVPPADWFHGITRTAYALCRDALIDWASSRSRFRSTPSWGTIPISPASRTSSMICAHLRRSSPSACLISPRHWSAVCRSSATARGANLFADVLDIPTVGAWDHAPFEMADQLLTPHPGTPAESRPGALALLQGALAHPRIIHWARDSAQPALTRGFGLLGSEPSSR